jgi:hypothetical protein
VAADSRWLGFRQRVAALPAYLTNAGARGAREEDVMVAVKYVLTIAGIGISLAAAAVISRDIVGAIRAKRAWDARWRRAAHMTQLTSTASSCSRTTS